MHTTLDTLGRSFSFPTPPARIVSLVPSVTETLFDLGAGEPVVGATDFCIFPESLPATITRIGGTKNPKIDLIRALAPDLVHMNLEENLERHATQIEEFAPVFVSEPKTVSDVAEFIRLLGVIHRVESAAAVWSERISTALTSPPVRTFTFACPIWKNPWMWCGGDTYVSNLVSTSGGRNVLAEQSRYPSIDLQDVLDRDPDIIFLPDEPFEFTAADVRDLIAAGARRAGGPFPGHLFTWHGTRTLKGLEFLRTVV